MVRRWGNGVRSSADILLVLALCLGASALCLAYPRVWLDEVLYNEPAANWALRGTLSSSAWWHVTPEEKWFGYSQLYTLTQALWLRFVGVSPQSARLPGILYATAGTLFLLGACKRSGMTRPARVLFVLILCSGMGFRFTIQSGRPDSQNYLLCCLLAYAFFIQDPLRSLMMFAVSALLPWAGLQPTITVCLAWAVSFALLRRDSLFRAGAMQSAAGIVAGAALLALYAFLGVFLKKYLLFLFGGQVTLLGRVAQAIVLGDSDSLILSLRTLWVGLVIDESLMALVIVCVALLWMRKRRGDQGLQAPARLLALGLVLWWGNCLLGEARIYYSWVGSAPIAMALGMVVPRQPSTRPSKWPLAGAFAATVALLPSLQTIAILRAQPRLSYEPVMSFVEEQMVAGDVIFASPEAFYALATRASEVTYSSYGGSRFVGDISEAEKARVSLIIGVAESIDELAERIGEQWQMSGRMSPHGGPRLGLLAAPERSLTGYSLVALRRENGGRCLKEETTRSPWTLEARLGSSEQSQTNDHSMAQGQTRLRWRAPIHGSRSRRSSELIENHVPRAQRGPCPT